MDSSEILTLVMRGTFAASLAILVVLASRRYARKLFGARIAYGLWLLVPACVAASYLPRRVVLSSPEVALPASPIDVPPTAVAVPGGIPATDMPFDTSAAVLALWAVGAMLSFLILLIDQRRFVSRLGLRREQAFYRARSDGFGPAVIGLIVPRIFVPAGFETQFGVDERKLMLAHERSHIRAGDVHVNALAAVAQCLNWFNPLFYVARTALRVDQELACDERVMRRHGQDRRTYAAAMLKVQLTGQAIPLGCNWPALGSGALKERIGMLGRAEPAPLVRVAGAFACAAAIAAGSAAAWAAKPAEVSYAQPGNQPSSAAQQLGRDLIDALQEGRTDRARQLIADGADVNYFRRGDGTPLTMAARLGDVAIARSLLTAGADVNRAAPGDGNPLIAAAGEGNVELIALFLKAGADVNGFVSGDETPLITAVRKDELAAARSLIDAGATVNMAVDAYEMSGVERRSPMSMARKNGNAAMIRLLREHGALN